MKKLLLATIFVIASIFIAYLSLEDTDIVQEFLNPKAKYALWAFLIGAIVTISLPLGAIAGLVFKPNAKITAIFTAFGAGALLAALSVELIAPTVEEIIGYSNGVPVASAMSMEHDQMHAIKTMASLIIGCIAGGFLFYTLDELINSKGGFLRKVGSTISHIIINKKEIGVIDEKQIDLAQKQGAQTHGGAPMAIWLGLLIDGIPESFVIGAGFLALLAAKLVSGTDPSFTEVLPYTLIAGLFLSNFPEALSASMGMKKSGMSTAKILFMWMSLVLIVAIGALIGYYIGSSIPHVIEIGIEGLAAGAMLTMIAQTMIPEAIHLGGSRVVGLSTLIGYLSAIAFKLLE